MFARPSVSLRGWFGPFSTRDGLQLLDFVLKGSKPLLVVPHTLCRIVSVPTDPIFKLVETHFVVLEELLLTRPPGGVPAVGESEEDRNDNGHLPPSCEWHPAV